jgi:hypothetical protein
LLSCAFPLQCSCFSRSAFSAWGLAKSHHSRAIEKPEARLINHLAVDFHLDRNLSRSSVAVASDLDTLGTQKRDERFCDTPITTDLLQPHVGQANDVDAPVAVENAAVALPEHADIASLLTRSWEPLRRHHLL